MTTYYFNGQPVFYPDPTFHDYEVVEEYPVLEEDETTGLESVIITDCDSISMLANVSVSRDNECEYNEADMFNFSFPPDDYLNVRESEPLMQISHSPPVPLSPSNSRYEVISNGYPIEATPGQRKYGGPPFNWEGPVPENGCEIYCGGLPRLMNEGELIPLFEKYGRIWEFRLMMTPGTMRNRGYAFIKYTTKEHARDAIKWMNGAFFNGAKLIVEHCDNKTRLYVANIPKAKTRNELFQEFSRRTIGLKDVIVYTPTSSSDDDVKGYNRGFCFLEYESHSRAFNAKKSLSASPSVPLWGCQIVVDWADPIREPDERIMSTVKVLFVRNCSDRATADRFYEIFSTFGRIERVKRLRDFAFVHFEHREHARKALEELQGFNLCGNCLEIEWGKPVTDKYFRSRVLRARERRTSLGGTAPQFGTDYIAESLGLINRIEGTTVIRQRQQTVSAINCNQNIASPPPTPDPSFHPPSPDLSYFASPHGSSTPIAVVPPPLLPQALPNQSLRRNRRRNLTRVSYPYEVLENVRSHVENSGTQYYNINNAHGEPQGLPLAYAPPHIRYRRAADPQRRR